MFIAFCNFGTKPNIPSNPILSIESKMKEKTVSIIVSPCILTGEGFHLTGDRLFDQEYPILSNQSPFKDEVMAIAESHRGRGKSVVVRPNFNESAVFGETVFSFFRELRSFDGGNFAELTFPIG
jgi:hypothetical protein